MYNEQVNHFVQVYSLNRNLRQDFEQTSLPALL